MHINEKHVLIAEDDDDDFEIFSTAVSELTFTVIVQRVENGNILLKILDSTLPDVLFLDILLPYKDGRHCLREIRANKKFDLLPIIIYSSVTNPQDIEFCYREGANLFIIKPSSFAELKEVLQHVLSVEWKNALYFPPRPDFVVKPK